MVMDKPGRCHGNMVKECPTGAWKDHLQSMQSDARHPKGRNPGYYDGVGDKGSASTYFFLPLEIHGVIN